jgi:hypothetical protein
MQSLPSHIKEILSQREREDQAKLIEEQVNSVSKWCNPSYKNVVQKLAEDKPNVLNEIDYIRHVYDRLPLDPAQKIRVRRSLVHLIESENLSSEQVDFIMSILKYYDCL